MAELVITGIGRIDVYVASDEGVHAVFMGTKCSSSHEKLCENCGKEHIFSLFTHATTLN